MFALGGNGGVYIILRRATFASFLVFVLLLEIICDLVGGFPPHSLHSYSSYTVCILVFDLERSFFPHHQSDILMRRTASSGCAKVFSLGATSPIPHFPESYRCFDFVLLLSVNLITLLDLSSHLEKKRNMWHLFFPC